MSILHWEAFDDEKVVVLRYIYFNIRVSYIT